MVVLQVGCAQGPSKRERGCGRRGEEEEDEEEEADLEEAARRAAQRPSCAHLCEVSVRWSRQ